MFGPTSGSFAEDWQILMNAGFTPSPLRMDFNKTAKDQIHSNLLSRVLAVSHPLSLWTSTFTFTTKVNLMDFNKTAKDQIHSNLLSRVLAVSHPLSLWTGLLMIWAPFLNPHGK